MDSDDNTDSDIISSSSSSCSDEDFEEFVEEFNEFGIRPYQFEPQRPDLSIDEDSDEDEPATEIEEEIQDSRLTNSEWCHCGNCQIMDREDECVCCQDINAIVTTCNSLVNDGENYANQSIPTCITQHPGFMSVCINKWVLRTAWFQYKQQYTDPYEGPEHKQYRHIAYRQLARWCWGFLGKDVRVVLPSCAVMCIRAHFPPPGLEDDFVFEGFHFAHE